MADDLDGSERARAELIAELERKNTELERYALTVSHDLKAPLTTVQAFARWVERSLDAGDIDSARRDVHRVADAVARMQQMLDDVLERARAGRLIHEPEDVALSELASEVLDSLCGPIDEHRVTVTIAEGLTMVRGDRVRLREALKNLVDNAVKFSGGSREPHITIGGLRRGDEKICYVRDNGMGIDPAIGNRIFGLLDKQDPSAPATGVGLALAKRIVEEHGGQIWFQSDGPGTGATFYFSVPSSQHPNAPEPKIST